MRVAVLNDVHGNLSALDAVLAEVPKDATIVVGGDIAGGPLAAEAIERLQGLRGRVHFIRGNADRVGDDLPDDDLSQRRIEWQQRHLSDETRRFLERLPLTETLDVAGVGPTLFCHGSPRSESEIVTAVTSDERLREILAPVEEQTVVCGHTHHQFDRTVAGTRIVNAGSVGMPYEGRPGAYWALLGPEVEFRRTEYDLEATSEAIRASGYPEPDELIELLTKPPSAQEAAEYFEQQALAAAT